MDGVTHCFLGSATKERERVAGAVVGSERRDAARVFLEIGGRLPWLGLQSSAALIGCLGWGSAAPGLLACFCLPRLGQLPVLGV